MALLATDNMRFYLGKLFQVPAASRVVRMFVAGTPFTLPLTSGSLALSVGMSVVQMITNFTTRFQFMQQFVTVKIVLNITNTSPPPAAGAGTGQTVFFWSETTGSPTATGAENAASLILSNGQASIKSNYGSMTWEPSSSEDLAFTANSTFIPVYLKAYTDVTNFGSNSSDSSSRFTIVPYVELYFRIFD
jgi:hypothetical protein